MQAVEARNKAGKGAGTLLICPGPPVAERGTVQASSQSLPVFEDLLNPLPGREGNIDMCICVLMFLCASVPVDGS